MDEHPRIMIPRVIVQLKFRPSSPSNRNIVVKMSTAAGAARGSFVGLWSNRPGLYGSSATEICRYTGGRLDIQRQPVGVGGSHWECLLRRGIGAPIFVSHKVNEGSPTTAVV